MVTIMVFVFLGGALCDERAGLSFVGCLCHVFMSCQNIYIGIYTIHCKISRVYKASVSPGFVKQIMPYLT
jgi:hypothetical protein